MKKPLPYTFIAALLMIVFCATAFAQKTVSGSNDYNEQVSWKPLKIQDDGTNNMNGVLFFKKNDICNSQNVIVLEAVNLNNYDVVIKWQESAFIFKEIVLPASATLAGNCNSADLTSAENKLVFYKSASADLKNVTKQALSTLTVTKVQ